jgi:vitamin B12 transporter
MSMKHSRNRDRAGGFRLMGTAGGAAALGATLALLSQQGAAQSLEVEPVVVTATRTAQTVDETLAPVTVITREQIERLQVQSLPELLNATPGIDFSLNGAFGKTSGLFMRGTNSDHVLVMIDGIRVGSATLGATAFQFLPAHQIERIEIVRGPRSSLYGADAIGGVIQIFTRQAQDRPLSINARAGYGSNASDEIGAGFNAQRDRTRYSANIYRFSTEGIDVQDTADPDKDGYDNTSLTANIGHEFSDRLSASASFFRAEGKTEYDNQFSPSVKYDTEYVQQVVSARINYVIDDASQFSLTAGQSRDESDSFEDNTRSGVFDTHRNDISLQYDFSPTDDHLLTVGTDFTRDSIDSSFDYEDTDRDTTGVFGQWQGAFERSDFVVGLRYDDNDHYGTETTGNVALGYSPWDRVKVVASYGTAFKAPSFNQLFFPGFGNPDLKPEKSETYEVGVRVTDAFGDWEVNAYRTDVDDLIETVDTGGFVFEPRNVAKARIEGLEATWSMATDGGWVARVSGSVIDPRDRDTDNRLRRRALRSLRVDLDRQFPGWSAGATVIAQGHRFEDADNDVKLDGYTLLNLRASYKLARAWSLDGRVDNVFAKEYETAAGFNSLKRYAFVSIVYSD